MKNLFKPRQGSKLSPEELYAQELRAASVEATNGEVLGNPNFYIDFEAHQSRAEIEWLKNLECGCFYGYYEGSCSPKIGEDGEG